MHHHLFKKTALVTLASVLLGVTGCVGEAVVTDDPVSQDAVETRVTVDGQGRLHFESAEDFFAALDMVGTSSTSQLDAWEERIGFVSQRRLLDQVMAQWSLAPTQESADEVLAANGDILEVTDDEILPRIRASGYVALIDRDGVFYVGGTIHKVLPELVITSQDGSLDTIEATMASMGDIGMSFVDRMSTPREGVRIMRYDGASTGDLQQLNPNGCFDYQSAYKIEGDRKIDFEMKTVDYSCSDCCGNFYHQVKAEGWLRGAKKNFWGNWDYSYYTIYDYQNIQFEVTAPKGTPGYGDNVSYWQFTYQTYTFTPPNGSSGVEKKGWWQLGLWNVGDQVKNSAINAPYFNKVKGQGKSRGTGANGWANICCGYAGGCAFPGTCVPKTVCYVGECGYVSNNCGGTLYCGACGGGGAECLVQGCDQESVE